MKKKLLKLLLVAGLITLFAGCGSSAEQSQGSGDGEKTIRVGSKDFTENLIVSEIYALALEDSGFTVERKANIASSVIHTSIVNDEIDLYPEYTGTGLLTILKEPMQTDPDQVFETVKTQYDENFKLTWLDYAEANDSQGLVITTSKAEELDISTISDLQKHAKALRFASQGEFDQREDGIVGLEKTYGAFDWKNTKVYDNSLKYEVLKNDEADVTPAYTTEGQLVDTKNFTVLKDDKNFWPPYNLAPVIQNSMLKKFPEIEDILGKINAQLDTETVTELNAKVDVDGEEYEEVAQKYFEENIKN